MTDPKHLPPRDCLVLYETKSSGPTWFHVSYKSDAGIPWYLPSPYGGTQTPVDASRVITWTELPEVE